MKKTICTVIVSILLLCTLVSNSLALQSDPSYSLIESIAALYDEYGEFDEWPEEGYLKAADILSSANILEKNIFADHSKLSATDMRNMLLEEFPGILTGFLNRVIENIWGNSTYWSLENKSWYTQLLIRHNLLTPFDRLYMMPDESDYSLDDIKAIAASHVIGEYNVDELILSQMDVYYSFFANQNDPDNPIWRLFFCEPVSKDPIIVISLDRKGNTLQCSLNNSVKDAEARMSLVPKNGRLYELPLEKQAQYAQLFSLPMFGLPNLDKGDISEEEAKSKADQFLISSGKVNQTQLDQFIRYASFILYGKAAHSYPFWTITYVDRTSNQDMYTVELSSDGALISVEYIDHDTPGIG